eukprot:Blabericola_migrator_1__155@NODE_1040_length_5626_cov_5_586796_g716_i0_p2_GENE_NODE_1040_length_5626_cov_5_586796_g716_i0NODE_1040_length_5626_cov_5_586796_g716_i0_p2_ORF_typecomplete_len498_score76_72MOEP19/PF16005_5/83MOEP19/PF16005_5/12_NODE_1040_length_5626_cov_5_586796_g716_i011942687
MTKYFLPPIIHFMAAVLRYDAALAQGSVTGQMVSHLVDDSASKKGDIVSAIVDTILSLMQVERMRVTSLRLLLQDTILANRVFRESFTSEIIDRYGMSLYQRALQDKLTQSKQEAERVVKLEYALWSDLKGKPKEVLLVLTNMAYYIMEKPEAIHAPDSGKVLTGAMIQKEAKIFVKRDYRLISRLVRGYPFLDLMAVVSSPSLEANQDLTDILILGRPELIEDLVDVFYALSGPSIDTRAQIMRDIVAKQSLLALLQQPILQGITESPLTLSDIRVASFVWSINSTDVDPKGMILIKDVLLVCRFAFEEWFCPNPKVLTEEGPWTFAGVDGDDITYREVRKGLQNFVGYDIASKDEIGKLLGYREKFRADSSADVDFFAPLVNLVGGTVHAGGNERGAYLARLENMKEKLFSVDWVFSLEEITDIVFGARATSSIHLSFSHDADEAEKKTAGKRKQLSKSLKIILLSDSTRERWKRKIAQGLHQHEAASKWHRTWK